MFNKHKYVKMCRSSKALNCLQPDKEVNFEKIKRWTVNNARNLKLSIILAKLKDVQVYVSSLSTLLQYLLQDIVRKIGNNQNYTCNFNITLSNQYCNYELRNFYQSNSRSEV